MKPHVFVLFVLLTIATGGAHAEREHRASSAVELAAVLKEARPGDTIVLESGTWRDATIDLTRGGTAGAPITIRAREPGRVMLTGASSLTFSAPYIVVDGLLFAQGALTKGSVVTFHSDHDRLTRSAIVDYNPPDAATPYYWVYFDGSDNRLDHSSFKGKSHQQPLVGNAIAGSRRNTTDHCAFTDIPYVANRNGREIFRIWGYGGNEELGEDGAFFTIEDNLFDHADGEGEEIISLKSNRNIVRRNTIRQTRGGITNRSGNYNTIEQNSILCEGYPGAYGMRVTGQHQRLVNNDIERCAYGIHLMAGEYIQESLTPSYQPIVRAGTPLGRVPAYNQPKHVLVAHNTLAGNQDADLLFGKGYKTGWPTAQRVLLPEENDIEYNLIRKANGGVAVDAPPRDTEPPLARFTFAANHFAGNVVQGGRIALTPVPAGFSTQPDAKAGVAVALHPLTARDVGAGWTPQ